MWKKLLKFEIRNFSDARRAGKEYALEDYYESMLLSEEEYQSLSIRERKNIHQKLEDFLRKFGKDSWAEERKKFHGVMRMRVQNGKESTMIPTENYKARKRKPNRTKEEIEAEKRRKLEREQEKEQRKTKSKMIIDYFTMWRNMYNRLPTLTEITNSEGRPLTVDEERTFNEEYARRTQE